MTNSPGGAPPHFLVFVPGYMGSKLRDRRTGEIVWIDLSALLKRPWRLKVELDRLLERMAYPNPDIEPAGLMDQVVFAPPLFKQEHYGRLITALQKMGYQMDPEAGAGGGLAAYTFPYDWRQDNRISAQQLGEAIEGWQKRHPGAQPWIMTHSNGGIVARWYIEKEGGKDRVGRLFLLGSPWDGVPQTMQVLLNGLEVMFLKVFNLYDFGARSRQVIRSFPSFYQLVPYKQTFLRDANQSPVDPFADPIWLENGAHRQMLLDGRRFNQELGTTLSVETLCFFGNRKETAASGELVTDEAGQWTRIHWDHCEAGDGTIPERSAAHPQAREKLPFVVSHGDIYVNTDVLEKMDWELARKYRLGTLARVTARNLKIVFEPEKDIYRPGDTIQVWATVESAKDGGPVFGAKISVRMVLSQALPGQPAPAGLAFGLPVMRGGVALGGADPAAAQLQASRQTPGRYEGSLAAPAAPGYYRLEATVEVAGEKPVSLEELILVEEQPDPAIYGAVASEPGSQDEIYRYGGYDSGYTKGPLPYEESPGRDYESAGWGEGDSYTSPSGGRGAPPVTPPAGGVRRGGSEIFEVMKGINIPPPSEGGMATAPGVRGGNEEAEPRWVNPEIYDQFNAEPVREPLELDKEYLLTLEVDLKQSGAGVQFNDAQAYQEGEDQIELSVYSSSKDFTVYNRGPQLLRVPRQGRSRNKARFDIQAKQEGVGEVTVLFFKENNFIQGMILKIAVGGTGEKAIIDVESLARPLEGAFALQPRSLSLFIKKRDEVFDVTLVGPVVGEASLPLSSVQLSNRIAKVRSALRDIVYLYRLPHEDRFRVLPPKTDPFDGINLAYQLDYDIDPAFNQEALRRLAEAGWLLYRELFYKQNDPTTKQMGDRLRELANGPEQLKIQIVSQQLLMPWGMLYLAEEFDEDNVDPNRFLGFRHIIEHIPLQRQMVAMDPRIKSRPRLNVSLNLNTDIDPQMGLSVVGDQQAYWERISSAGRVSVTVRQTGDEFVKALRDPENSDQLIYCYCHAVAQKPDEGDWPDPPFLVLREEQAVSLGELELRAPDTRLLNSTPLVFLNACESAQLSPLLYDGFMPYFTGKGARGMIGTECEVPARFAAEWARRFFDKFLAGEPVGQIFLDLRQQFFRDHHNILGLLYALYCDGDTRIEPRLV